ncbi:TetR/AcrR family transcriptional regulator C-terminal domain-containing protein [Acidipropionibacterium virtanenii]|uniref:Tetracycline repressor protein class D n=1 Tax=Acidipropionibacterium virtanenii TaxID=2057246 RepID=A0A344URY7_9ACTN|nr:TetR/AcrR family transcriptional regulator C-terminal domain-containing protein [Acidipropionibacterium virtanenii]AXE38035.1 Tetracycline repressor protein class D [Acidipropionibacterium virtanenii]
MNQPRIQGRHAGLNRDQILEAAVALIDAEGRRALSMRRLAQELGVEAMTLYHYVRNKGALEDAIVEHVLAESVEEPDGDGSWQEVLADYARALHRGLLAHPGVVPLFATRPALTPRGVRTLEDLLGILTDAGFTPRTALTMVHATAACVLGQHVGRGDEDAEEATASALPAGEDLPLMRAALADGVPGLEERFQIVLTALVSGYEATLSG